MDRLHEFLESTDVPGKIIFAKVWGSRSHNTNKDDSDWDFSGVYACPTQQVLSMDGIKDCVVGEDPDFQFCEVHNFCKLLLKGIPQQIESLFTDRMFTSSPTWELLRQHRNKFLSQEVVKQYLGYMQGQLKRLITHEGKKGLHTSGGSYNEKWAYHAARLGEDAKRIASGGTPVVWKEGLERDFLMKIRHGEISWEYMRDYISSTIDATDALKPWPLPEYGDKDLLNAWLLEFRKENW